MANEGAWRINIIFIDKSSATNIRVVGADATLEINEMEQNVSLVACLTNINNNMPVKISENRIRENGTCMSKRVGYQRILEYHSKKYASMRTAETGAQIHFVCKRPENECTTELQ